MRYCLVLNMIYGNGTNYFTLEIFFNITDRISRMENGKMFCSFRGIALNFDVLNVCKNVWHFAKFRSQSLVFVLTNDFCILE